LLEAAMKHFTLLFAVSFALLSLTAFGQEVLPDSSPAAPAPEEGLSTEGAKLQAQEIAKQVDQSPQAQKVSAGILEKIYLLAEKLESPMFYWGAFALMATGVASFALQLGLGKLFVLARMSISLTEILSDTLGLAISLVGLVLTTQAAAQNSSFTDSPASVLSASAVGVVLGFLFFRWGTAQELAAADGRKIPAKPEPVKPKA
jgi:hypothetical protein